MLDGEWDEMIPVGGVWVATGVPGVVAEGDICPGNHVLTNSPTRMSKIAMDAFATLALPHPGHITSALPIIKSEVN